MKRVVSVAVFLAALAGGVAIAQQPPAQPSPDQRHDQHMQGGMCPMMSGGMMGGGMTQGGMMSGMMGMMGGQSDSRMMQMRGEMMKAMGDIMMKYGKMMETPGR
jgi:hypothetical protein